MFNAGVEIWSGLYFQNLAIQIQLNAEKHKSDPINEIFH
jgi:hypothetical protein